ncbi:MAG TPA: FAD-dependent oxidoreductase [Syntrophaceae bacterium]|jgi:L-2-hydroxyglutarate oxidase LhgO|nr:FAD-dependent oxidoreductase [Syntrophaceae bacterium]HBL52905.1 FAD-dependent oxidoreductase [Syntrophaceae bacterium]
MTGDYAQDFLRRPAKSCIGFLGNGCAMEHVDITIIGAGVIGLAIAAELARPDLSIFILEKNPAHGGGISSRNSEVIHAGLYYPGGSLKAELCVAGNRMLYDIAARNGIPHQKTGKLIVAMNSSEIEAIEKLHENGCRNGVKNLSLLNKRQIEKMEPPIQARAALYSSDTGMIDTHALMHYFLKQALSKKVNLVCRTQVLHIEKDINGWRIYTLNDKEGNFDYSSQAVINAAGLSSDTIANLAGGHYQLHYCKGDYCSISGIRRGMVQRLIYPAPVENHAGLGVHLTIDLNGRLKLGPDATYIERREDYQVAAGKASLFYEHARKFLPFLKPENIHPDMAGIRPKLQGPNEAFHDFVMREDAPGFVNLVGIESPGLTASPAIARYVKERFL